MIRLSVYHTENHYVVSYYNNFPNKRKEKKQEHPTGAPKTI